MHDTPHHQVREKSLIGWWYVSRSKKDMHDITRKVAHLISVKDAYEVWFPRQASM